MTDYLSFETDLSRPEAVSVYDELPLWSAMFGLLMLRHLELRRDMRVLDVGCGTGFPLLELAQRLGTSCHVVGLDPWEPAVERARLKAEVVDPADRPAVFARLEANLNRLAEERGCLELTIPMAYVEGVRLSS